MEKILSLRHERYLYQSRIDRKQQNIKTNKMKHRFQQKILEKINNEANLEGYIDGYMKIQVIVKKKYKQAFMAISTNTNNNEQYSYNKIKNRWRSHKRLEDKSNIIQRKKRIRLIKLYRIFNKKKYEAMQSTFILLKNYNNTQIYHQQHKRQYSKYIKVGAINLQAQWQQRQNQSLDFLNISAIQPTNAYHKHKQKNIDSLHQIYSELNTQQSTQYVNNSQPGHLQKLEQEINNLQNRVKRVELNIRQLKKFNQQYTVLQQKQIKQLQAKIAQIKQQQNRFDDNKEWEQLSTKSDHDHEKSMMVLGKYMRLCLQLQDKITVSIQLIQEIFNNQKPSNIHPKLIATLYNYIQTIKNEADIGQNIDFL